MSGQTKALTGSRRPSGASFLVALCCLVALGCLVAATFCPGLGPVAPPRWVPRLNHHRPLRRGRGRPTDARSTSPPTRSPAPTAPRRRSGGSATTTASSPASAARSSSRTAGRAHPGLRLRHLRRAADHVGRRRRLPPGPGHEVRRPRRRTVAITEFADRVVLGGHPYVAVYSRVRVDNPTGHAVRRSRRLHRPRPARHGTRRRCRARHAVDHDYVVAVDRFGTADPWPSGQRSGRGRRLRPALRAHARLLERAAGRIAQVSVPDAALDDAYRSGFIYTLIARSGNAPRHRCQQLRGRVQPRRDRDPRPTSSPRATTPTRTRCCSRPRNVVGARAVRRRAVDVLRAVGRVPDEDGRPRLRQAELLHRGPPGASQPSIEDTAHRIAADRTGPNGIMEATNDIDSNGYWTVDDYEALIGLAAYRYLAAALGNPTEAAWAARQYDSLLAAMNTTLAATIAATTSTTCPARCSSPTPRTGAATRRTPTGPRRSSSAAGRGRARSSARPSAGPA